jgi:hypothetical protein
MSTRTTREQQPWWRQREAGAETVTDEVSRLAALVDSLAQSRHAPPWLRPCAEAAEKAAEDAVDAAARADAAVAAARAELIALRRYCAALQDAVSGTDNAPSSRLALRFAADSTPVTATRTVAVPAPRSRIYVASQQQHQHAFSHAPAALRIFRFATDTAPRAVEIAHVSKFLRECAVEFGSVDATLPGALRNAYARGRYFRLRDVVERNWWRCPWLAGRLLACRSGAPVPAAALAPDVTRHDVNWGADGARRSEYLCLTHDGFGLSRGGRFDDPDSDDEFEHCWAQGPVGVTRGKHFFQVSVTTTGDVTLGWVDRKLSTRNYRPSVGTLGTKSSGAAVAANCGRFFFGTAPLAANSIINAPRIDDPCAIGCLLNMDATPARMTVFVDGEPLEAQCDYDFPKDGRAWFPSVALRFGHTALHSCAL